LAIHDLLLLKLANKTCPTTAARAAPGGSIRDLFGVFGCGDPRDAEDLLR
jgi:hypothetical protein